jgi:hypothetical protein
MFRTLGVLILGSVLTLGVGTAGAQDLFQVTAARANVRQQPTTASVVVAHVDRDTVLTVEANLGSWLRVELPDAGGRALGYIHRSVGTLRHDEPQKTSPASPATPALEPAAVPSAASDVRQPDAPSPMPQANTVAKAQTAAEPVRTLGHPHAEAPARLGLGGRAGGFTFGIGASIRSWQKGPLGFELQLSHYGVGYQDAGLSAQASVGVTQIAPLLLYRFAQSDEDDVVITPYVGGGMNFYRATTSASATGYGFTEKESSSELSKGIVAMGGAEVRFKSAPRLTVRGDLGYYTTAIPFGMQIGGIAWSVSGHWYVR